MAVLSRAIARPRALGCLVRGSQRGLFHVRAAPHLLAPRVGLSDQLRGTGQAPSEPLASAPAGSAQVIAANRDFLLAAGTAGRGAVVVDQVLIHDHRDLRFLKKVTSVGLFGTLMSSSGLAYAVSFGLGTGACGFIAFQTVGAAFMLFMYLRTYVARAVLDPRRARLVITGCGPFGEPLATDQQFPLTLLQPGVDVSNGYIKFRTRGAMWNPSSWIWYRMPRAPTTTSTGTPAPKPGAAQVGHRPTVGAAAGEKAAMELRPEAPRSQSGGSTSAPSSPVRRFPGAGLGSAAAASPWGEDEVTGRPSGPSTAVPLAASFATLAASEAAAAAPRKSLAGLRLQHGLPADAREEELIIEFFKDPTAYTA